MSLAPFRQANRHQPGDGHRRSRTSAGRRNRRGLVLIRRIERRTSGQALVVTAVVLPFLAILLFTAVEVGHRIIQRIEVEDALQNASRSAVQTFAYDKFAKNTQALKAPACAGTTAPGGGCSGNGVAQLATAAFIANLSGVGGLDDGETPVSVANRIVWTIGPTGGACAGAAYRTPVVCGALQAPMQGLVGFGSWAPNVSASETIDRPNP